jgi:hypothetical protein
MNNSERAEQELAELRKKKADYESLLSSPGWRRLKGDLAAQGRARKMMEFNSKISNLDEAFAAAGERGEIRGISLAIELPEFFLLEVQADIQTWLDKQQALTEGEHE